MENNNGKNGNGNIPPSLDSYLPVIEEKDKKIFDPKFVDILNDLERDPIGGDEFSRLSVQGFLLHTQNDPTLLNLLSHVRGIRSSLDHPFRRIHAIAIATIHGVNHIKMNIEGKNNYPYDEQLYTPERWQRVYEAIQEEHLKTYVDILINKYIHTTDPNRGIFFPTLIHTLFKEKADGVTILDNGASVNWVCSRLACGKRCAQDDPYSTDDQTEYNGQHGIVMYYANQPVHIAEAMGIDQVDPLVDPAWFDANRYIRNVNPRAIEQTHERIERYRDIEHVNFRVGNMMDPPVEQRKWDIVSYITSLYEEPYERRKKIMAKGLDYVAPGGIQLVQDYCEIDENGELTFPNKREEYLYGTYIRGEMTNGWKEVAKWKNSQCREAKNGKHFYPFMRIAA